MSELIELLKRWAELEPERCNLIEDGDDKGCYALNLKNSRDDEKNLAFIYLDLDIDNRDWAIIQQSVQRAIVSRDLRFSLENAPEGVYFGAVRDKSQHSACLAQEKEPAVALLRAYLVWLEKQAEVAAGGAV